MDEILQEFVDSRGVSMRVDRQASAIRGVKLLGLESRNRRRYLPLALAQAIGLYEGAKVNVNHPKGHPLAVRDYQDRLGVIRNVTLRGAEGLYGDLHFNPKHALCEQLLWDAEHSPENVGLSHNVQARTSRQADETVVEAILQVQSVDLVADPATTRGLFEGTSAALPTAAMPAATLPAGADAAGGPTAASGGPLSVERLRREHPELAVALQEALVTENRALQAQIDQFRAAEAAQKRHGLARRLLAEFKLPDPEGADTDARAIVSEAFWQTLLAAPHEQAMRTLVQERAELVGTIRSRSLSGQRWGQPLSREQGLAERVGETVTDAESFARAIR